MYPNQQHITRLGYSSWRRVCNNSEVGAISAGGKVWPVGWNQGADVSLTIMLVCAVLASLGVGVLLAYGVCVAMFEVFRMHARQVEAEKTAGRVVAAQGLKS